MFIFNGGQEPENNVKAAIELAYQLDYATPAGTYRIPIPAGYEVDRSSGGVVTEAFNATSPSMKHGDGDDDDGFLDNTDIALATAATATTPAVKLVANSGNPYANGKYYAVDDTYDIVWDPGTGGTTGVYKGWVVLRNLKKGGVPAGATTKTPL